MKGKLENLLSFNDFKNNWNSEKTTKTKRTETGLDIVKESIDFENIDEKINKIEELISQLSEDDDMFEDVTNELRDAFVKMEKDGEIDENQIDELDDKYDGDWKSWISEAIRIVPDYTIDSVLSILGEDVETNTELDNELEVDTDENVPVEYYSEDDDIV